MKVLGGVAPFGYRWQNGQLVVDENEAPVRKLMYELFLKHRRKKTVAKLLNDLGYRTRNASLFSDTTVDRLLRDTTAKGTREVDGTTIEVEPIISAEIWERVSSILGGAKGTKRATALFSGFAYCGCGGRMLVPSNAPKYVCPECRHKILAEDLEAIFHSQLEGFRGSENQDIHEHWRDLTQKEKRILIEQICDRIVIGRDTIHIGFGYSPHPFKAATDGQRNETGNRSPGAEPVGATDTALLSEPLLSETEAAKFLGISKMTVLRKRNAGEIGYFRVGFRILYSKEKHLIPYLKKCEKQEYSNRAFSDGK